MVRGVKGTGPYGIGSAKAALKSSASGPAAVPAPAPAAASSWKPLGSVDIDSLAGDELKDYARRAGVIERDVVGLTEDRLRQNVKVVIANHFDLLTED